MSLKSCIANCSFPGFQIATFSPILQEKLAPNNSSFGSMKDAIPKSESQAKFNKAFMRKIPPGAEAHNVLVGEVDFLSGDQQIVAFLRLAKPTYFGNYNYQPLSTFLCFPVSTFLCFPVSTFLSFPVSTFLCFPVSTFLCYLVSLYPWCFCRTF